MRVEEEAAAGAGTDLMTFGRVKEVVDKLPWVTVLLWEAGDAGVFVGQC